MKKRLYLLVSLAILSLANLTTTTTLYWDGGCLGSWRSSLWVLGIPPFVGVAFGTVRCIYWPS